MSISEDRLTEIQAMYGWDGTHYPDECAVDELVEEVRQLRAELAEWRQLKALRDDAWNPCGLFCRCAACQRLRDLAVALQVPRETEVMNHESANDGQ